MAFIRAHPEIASGAELQQLHNRTGLYFYDTAVVRPMWAKDRVVLRLEKYTEDWAYRDPEDYDPSRRTVCEDITEMSDEELDRVLDRLFVELHPDDANQEDLN